MANDWGLISAIFRGAPEGIAHGRMGRGLVANVTRALWPVCALAAICVVALKNTPELALIAGGGVIATYLIFMFVMVIFTAKRPVAAMLGDIEFLTYWQNQAAKGMATLPAGGPIIDPESPIQDVTPPGVGDV